MSKPARPGSSLPDVGIHMKGNPRDSTYGDKRGTPKVSSKSSDFVYVNSSYVGSLNSVNDVIVIPPTSVVREQYWTCSKWSFAQRLLAVVVGVLSGAVIGLTLVIALKKGDTDVIAGIFRSHPAPD
ncbi:uncharacterized protein [Battus philenor]|uniref:uncharacterized protein n=1 Tax=Battus philenor TaxID=42288 RepID=UPI0035D0D384